MDEPINFVVFSGTDDKLQALAVMIDVDHGLSAEAGPEGRAAVDALAKAGQASWADTLRMAKELGELDIQACSLSMDLLGLEESDLDPLVDGTEGVTAFYLNAGDGQIVFI